MNTRNMQGTICDLYDKIEEALARVACVAPEPYNNALRHLVNPIRLTVATVKMHNQHEVAYRYSELADLNIGNPHRQA